MWRKRPDHHTIPAHSAQVGQPGSFTAVISRQQAQIRDLTAENGQLRRAEYAALTRCADKDRRIADAEADLAQAFDTINDREEANRARDRRIAELADGQQELAALRAQRERYIDSYTEWAVRLSRGTHIDCLGESDARQKAAMYRGTLLCCDVLSTDWRDADPAPEAGAAQDGTESGLQRENSDLEESA